MTNLVDLTGRKFGRLTVLERGPDWVSPKTSTRASQWLCRCDCGTELLRPHSDLRRQGRVNQSCGCWNRERSTVHGMHGTPTYRSWASMIARCTRPAEKAWPYYGGRGIKVCDQWRDFAAFVTDMGERPDGLTLDRIDSNGNYEPSNCRWATTSEQNLNRRPRAATTTGAA